METIPTARIASSIKPTSSETTRTGGLMPSKISMVAMLTIATGPANGKTAIDSSLPIRFAIIGRKTARATARIYRSHSSGGTATIVTMAMVTTTETGIVGITSVTIIITRTIGGAGVRRRDLRHLYPSVGMNHVIGTTVRANTSTATTASSM